MRYHVYLNLTADALAERDPSITVTVNAADDLSAVEWVCALWPDLEFDITEVEPAE